MVTGTVLPQVHSNLYNSQRHISLPRTQRKNISLQLQTGESPLKSFCSFSGFIYMSSLLYCLLVVDEMLPSQSVCNSQCRNRNCPGFDPSTLRHSGIWGAADEAVLNIVHKNKKLNPNLLYRFLYTCSIESRSTIWQIIQNLFVFSFGIT
jgi:hypothetical protein